MPLTGLGALYEMEPVSEDDRVREREAAGDIRGRVLGNRAEGDLMSPEYFCLRIKTSPVRLKLS